MEMDYEEVIHLLEAEIAELKAQLADYSEQNKVSKQPSLVTMVSLPLSCSLFSFSFHLHV